MSEGTTPEKMGRMWDLAQEITRGEYLLQLDHARDDGLFRPDLAHWEAAKLFQCCLPLAIFDAQRVADFAAFEAVWSVLVGEGGLAWLPSLYLAAAASPLVVAEARRAMVVSTLYNLDMIS